MVQNLLEAAPLLTKRRGVWRTGWLCSSKQPKKAHSYSFFSYKPDGSNRQTLIECMRLDGFPPSNRYSQNCNIGQTCNASDQKAPFNSPKGGRRTELH
jgi:hypothetical protein